MTDRNARIIQEFRANDGKVGGPFEGATMLLLHTKGAKSGQPRVNPLVYLPDGERYVTPSCSRRGTNGSGWSARADQPVTMTAPSCSAICSARRRPSPDVRSW